MRPPVKWYLRLVKDYLELRPKLRDKSFRHFVRDARIVDRHLRPVLGYLTLVDALGPPPPKLRRKVTFGEFARSDVDGGDLTSLTGS